MMGTVEITKSRKHNAKVSFVLIGIAVVLIGTSVITYGSSTGGSTGGNAAVTNDWRAVVLRYLTNNPSIANSYPDNFTAPAANMSNANVQPRLNDWTSFIFDWKNSRDQKNSTVNASNIKTLHQTWFFNTKYAVTSTPIVVNGNVYITDWGGNVYSVNVVTGAMNWNINLGSTISSTPAVAYGQVYVSLGPNETKTFALNQYTGNVAWKRTAVTTMKGAWASPTVFDGMVYIGTAENETGCECNVMEYGKMYAYNAITGNVVWTFNTKQPGSNAGGAGIWSSVTYDPAFNAIYFGTGNSYGTGNTPYAYSIVSLNAQTGTPNWHHAIYNTFAAGGDEDFGSTPNLFSLSLNGKTYKAVGLGAKDSIYYIVNRSDGKLLEKVNITKIYGLQHGYKNGIIGVPGYQYVANSFTNPEIFIPSFTDGHGGFLNTSICCGHITAYEPSSNTVAWTFSSDSNIVSHIALVPGMVWIGDITGQIYGLNATNGNVLFYKGLYNTQIEGGISSAEGYIFVPTSFSADANTLGVYEFKP